MMSFQMAAGEVKQHWQSHCWSDKQYPHRFSLPNLDSNYSIRFPTPEKHLTHQSHQIPLAHLLPLNHSSLNLGSKAFEIGTNLDCLPVYPIYLVHLGAPSQPRFPIMDEQYNQ